MFDTDLAAAIEAGADCLIKKPFLISEILDQIGRVTGVKYKIEPECHPAAVDFTVDSKDMLAALDSHQVHILRLAILRGDQVAFMRHVEEFDNLNEDAISGLRTLASNYEYDTILDLLLAS